MKDEKEKKERVTEPELPEEFKDARSMFYYHGSELDLAVYQGRDDRDLNLDKFLKSFHYLVKTVQPMDDIGPDDRNSLQNLEQFIKDYIQMFGGDPGEGLPKLAEGYRFFAYVLGKYSLNFKHTKKLRV